MSGVLQQIRSHLLILAPFLKSVLVYFMFVRDPVGELWTTLLKCAPIVSLMLYILLQGFAFHKGYKYCERILLGLIFSCMGDALLNIGLFPHGMGAFAVAQIFYISAFGWYPLKLHIGLPLYLTAIGIVYLVYPHLDAVLAIGLPVYATLLVTMCWRSLARAQDQRNALAKFCAWGSVIFVVSDGVICFNMFIVEIPSARIWIMLTYYLAQFAIVLSTANEINALTQTQKRTR